MSNIPLEHLAATAAEGDLPAAEALIATLHSHLVAFLHLLGVPESDIDDLAQNVTIKMYRSLPRYDAAQPFLPWLRTIARREVANHWRGLSRRERRVLEFRSRCEQLLRSREADPASNHDALQRCIAALKQRQRAIVEAHYYQGHTSATIASHLGMSAVAVRKALMTVRDALRRCLEAAGHD
ncbi:MAG: sigma-70 family RNA polymerase sigma factor [Planctomycetota bacterium]|nr:sigma-70 family RNA polymerase sigma factor [Planctomycetota bacterium]